MSLLSMLESRKYFWASLHSIDSILKDVPPQHAWQYHQWCSSSTWLTVSSHIKPPEHTGKFKESCRRSTPFGLANDLKKSILVVMSTLSTPKKTYQADVGAIARSAEQIGRLGFWWDLLKLANVPIRKSFLRSGASCIRRSDSPSTSGSLRRWRYCHRVDRWRPKA